jgi:predicted ribosomally synthesized peptide with SipW-like signal peptide
MIHKLNSRIVLSMVTILAAGALIVGATYAFFSDTETSTGNVFAAGELDLKIDSEAHYNGLVCTEVDDNVYEWTIFDEEEGTTRPDLVEEACEGTFGMKDLGEGDLFFSLSDIKPGDFGENTISVHVDNNDAWGRIVIDNISDDDNLCSEPESEAGDISCGVDEGDLQENMVFSIWLDHGAVNGFQCGETAECEADPTEGDNIFQPETEAILVTPGTLDEGGETLNIWEGLAAVHDITGDAPGIMEDGRLVGGITYYFGLNWELPDSVGNMVQTDSLTADVGFEAVQHRNNPGQLFN